MKQSHTLRLILGDQLNRNHSWFRGVDPGAVYVLMEIRQETDTVAHHIQKVAAFFAAMRAFAEELRNAGHRVVYLKLDDPDNTQDIPGNLKAILDRERAARIAYQQPDEWRLDTQLNGLGAALKVAVRAVDSEHFLTARTDLADHFKGKKHFIMESYYRAMRKRFGILMDGSKPVGARWNFDRENRNRYDGATPIPPPQGFGVDVADIVEMVNRAGVNTIGTAHAGDFTWPVDRRQSLGLLNYFTEHLLPGFGTYQDAMTTRSWSLFHSRLSFSLNTKMLDPKEVIDAAVRQWEKGHAKIADVEGFVRQILGWREYVRGIYWAHMPGYASLNVLEHRAPLPKFYWTGETKMRCLRRAISQSLQYAYAHHIQRLMVTGNFALLAGVAPDAVDEWYLGIYIDAVQWVEMVNTRGMSQFADGGIVATKPYAASAAYVNRMSDYCTGCRYDHRQRTGEDACPFNCLYWAFLHRHGALLRKNPRMGMMYRAWDRKTASDRRALLAWADRCLADLERL